MFLREILFNLLLNDFYGECYFCNNLKTLLKKGRLRNFFKSHYDILICEKRSPRIGGRILNFILPLVTILFSDTTSPNFKNYIS